MLFQNVDSTKNDLEVPVNRHFKVVFENNINGQIDKH